MKVPLLNWRKWFRPQSVSASILFVDMAASSRLKLIENIKDVWIDNIYTLHDVASRIIHESHGKVSKTIGDCVMAYFVEANHSQDAVKCAALLLDEFERRFHSALDREWDSTLGKFEVTIGVSSGEVFFLYPNDPYGPAVDLAARLQGVAKPGTAVILRETVEGMMDGDSYDQLSTWLKAPETILIRGFGNMEITRLV